MNERQTAAGDWFAEPEPSEGLARTVTILRARWWVAALLVALAVGAALVIVPTLQKVYQARATLLAEPVSNTDATLAGLGLPRDSSDPTRGVESLSQLIATTAVATRVRTDLGLTTTARSLLKKVNAVPVAQSNTIAVTARAKSPELAAQLANAFAQGAIEERTAVLHQELDQLIPRLRSQIARLGPDGQLAAQPLQLKLQELESLRGGSDPTLHIATLAEPPSSPVSPRLALSVVAAALAGLILGVGAILGSEVFDRRLQREEDLRRYRLPILARVPLVKGQRRAADRDAPLLPGPSSSGVADAYQLLAATVAAFSDQGNERHSVVVTGPSASAGKSTTALHLAASLVELNQEVALIEVDARQPGLAATIGVDPGAVLSGQVNLADAFFVQTDRFGPGVRMLLQPTGKASTLRVMTSEEAGALVQRAKSVADWAIFDAPPPNYVSDGLTIAKHGDLVIVVVRLGRTRDRELAELAELFAQQRINPLGFVVVGSKGRSPYLSNPRPAARFRLPSGEQRRGVVSDDAQAGAVDS